MATGCEYTYFLLCVIPVTVWGVYHSAYNRTQSHLFKLKSKLRRPDVSKPVVGRGRGFLCPAQELFAHTYWVRTQSGCVPMGLEFRLVITPMDGCY